MLQLTRFHLYLFRLFLFFLSASILSFSDLFSSWNFDSSMRKMANGQAIGGPK
jgi:hypothetical protein